MPPTWCSRRADVAVVGVGGGREHSFRDCIFGARNIRGIEINPAIFEVLTDKFADFSGHLDRAARRVRWSTPRPAATSTIHPIDTTWCRSR